MRFRVGILDVCAMALVLVVILLPGPALSVESAYERFMPVDASLEEHLAAVDAAQARVLLAPSSGAAADELGRLLEQLGQHDQALRAAGETSARGGPDAWRAELAIASAHAARIDIERAQRFAERAMESCREAGAACASHDEVRLNLYLEQLDAGMQALAAGINPHLEPERFRRKIQEVHPTATFRPVRARGN